MNWEGIGNFGVLIAIAFGVWESSWLWRARRLFAGMRNPSSPSVEPSVTAVQRMIQREGASLFLWQPLIRLGLFTTTALAEILELHPTQSTHFLLACYFISVTLLNRRVFQRRLAAWTQVQTVPLQAEGPHDPARPRPADLA